MTGFRYAQLGRDMANADTFSLIEWLARQKSYSPQPYEQLAGALRNVGHGEKAKELLVARGDRERGTTTSTWSWFGLWLSKLFIGYGQRPLRTVCWAMLFVLVGATVLRATGQGRAHQMPYGLAYSVDRLIPALKLRERHSQIDLHGYARYYFYFHAVMGYVLTFYLIAGLTGLVK